MNAAPHMPGHAFRSAWRTRSSRRRRPRRRHLRRRRLFAGDPRSRCAPSRRHRSRSDGDPRRRPTVAASGGRLVLVEGRFSELDEHARGAGLTIADGVVLDIGVSSMQLDQAERGFSFRGDGPLDMRMSLDGPSAADILNTLDGREIARILQTFGEERQAGRIARAIVARRGESPFVAHRRSRRRLRACPWIEALRRDSSGDANVPGDPDCGQRRTRRIGGGARRGGTAARRRRTARGRDVSFAGGPHRQALPRRSRPRHRPKARGTCRRKSYHPRPSARSPKRSSHRRRSARRTRAPARPSFATPFAPTRRPRPIDPDALGVPTVSPSGRRS